MVLMLPVLCCCKKENKPFKLKVELQGLGAQKVRVVYCGADGGVVDNWIQCDKNIFEIEGLCSNPSLLLVYNSSNMPIMKLIVAGGDELEVKGKVLDNFNLDVKGSEVAEQYNEFMKKHKMDYRSADHKALNTAIEKFVKDNPKSVVSTVLVMLDYCPDDDAKIDKLLDAIDSSAKPESLVASYNMLKSRNKTPATNVSSLNMIEQGTGDFETSSIVGSKPSVILFWDREMKMDDRRLIVDQLKKLNTDSVQVMDISLDVDSTGWFFATRDDAVSWKHYWAPGSMMNDDIVKLQVSTTPTIIVTDSLGQQQYRGSDPAKARQAAVGML